MTPALAFVRRALFAALIAAPACLPDNVVVVGPHPPDAATAPDPPIDAADSVDAVDAVPDEPSDPPTTADGADGACPAGQTRCANACVDTDSSTAHCGACGHACALHNATPACRGGACAIAACAPGWADCDGRADDGCETRVDGPSDCGACGVRCDAGQVCSRGACTNRCDDDETYCAGVCAHTASDPSHCGACGAVCPARPNAAPRCASGRCTIACDDGWGDCDRDPSNGCEVDLRTSTTACGACGRVCAAGPHAVPRCAGGGCTLGCDPGFADCDRDPSNGCEVDLASSAMNCGACGARCHPPRNGSAVCAGGSCGATCDPGWGDCDGNASNGCETSLVGDVANCGACGLRCPGAGPDSHARCAMGRCVLSCAAGSADCDHDASNGCETDLGTSPMNCGACGNACGATSTCRSGVCVASSDV